MSPEDFTDADIRVTDEEGKRRTLKWNEPRLGQQSLPSRVVDPEQLGLAGVRLRAEAILAKNCGPDEIDALVELGPEVRPVLVKMALRSDDCEPYCQQRVAAISAIGELRVLEASEALRTLAADPNETEAVRAHSVLALGRIGGDAAVDYLAHVAETYKSPTIRAAAVTGLGMSGNLRAVAPLVRALADDADSDVQLRAHAAIGAMEKLHDTRLADVKVPPAIPQVRRPDRNRRSGGAVREARAGEGTLSMAEHEWKGRVQRSVEFPDSVIPTHMRRIDFDKRRGVDIKFGPIRWTAVPAVGVLGEGDRKLDFRDVVRNPATWMVLKGDALDVASGLELEVEKGREKDRVDLRVLRSSGRPIAEGTAWASGDDVEFEVRVLGVRRRGGRGTTLRGVLDSSGRLRMKAGGG